MSKIVSIPSRPDARHDRYQAKRREAIKAAAAVFARKGYHGASTADIAAELGIKQGSLYYYFKAKEQALEEVCKLGLTAYVARMEKICYSDKPFAAKLLAIVTSHLSSYRQDNDAMKVHNDQRLYLRKEKRTELKRLGSHYRQLLEQVLQKGVDNGALRPGLDCHFAAYSIIGICNYWGAMLIRDRKLDLYDTIDNCMDLLFGGVLNRKGAKT